MFIKLYAIAFTVFLGIDAVWLILIAKNFYAKYIGYLMAKNPNLLAALIFYLIFIAGLVFFVITPALDKKMWTQALLAGIFFGLVTYATYDLTNLATVKDWPLIITIVDLIWGMFVSAAVSVVTYFIAIKFKL
ncbi:MAG: DUF2177 family protein [Candidatus Roizmanbacteria bacterium]|nr:DUF2177 family protein [Candidatus Roizmanbacteria bacterium]